MLKLLNREIEENKKDEEERDRKKMRQCKPNRCWVNWLPGLFIYAGTVVRAQPERALSLIQYMDIIYRAYVDFPGHAWLL